MLLLRKGRSHAVSDILTGASRKHNPCFFFQAKELIIGFIIFQVGNDFPSFLIIGLPRFIQKLNKLLYPFSLIHSFSFCF